MIVLRDDQLALKHSIYSSWNSGNKNVLAVLPTGGGKSVIVSDIVNDGNALGMRQPVIAHRKELVGQMSLHIAERGIFHRLIAPKDVIAQITAKHRAKFKRSFVSPTALCSVVGIDTLNARAQELKPWADQQDRWVTDEAHHVLRANKWGKGVELFGRAYGLGVTASPVRGDGMGLGRHHDGVFDDMVQGLTMRQLISIGALTDYEIAIPESDFNIDDDAITPAGDFSPVKMREASQRSHIVGDVVKEYIKRAYGKRGICFTTDVETAGKIAKEFNEMGIPAASVSAETPSATRDNYIERFRSGQFWVLVNVDLFGEGFDVPAVEVVMMARPTASLAVYLQQFGRALRTLAGKLYGLVIDHVSNWKRHKFPDKAHVWSLDRRDKRGKQEKDPEDIPLTACRNCSRPYDRALFKCPHCGNVPVISPTDRSSIAQIDGDLILLDRAKIAEMMAATVLPSPADVGNRTRFVAGDIAAKGAINRQIEKHAAQQRLSNSIAQWAAIQRQLGRDDQQSYRRFYLTLGMDVLTALSADRSRDDYEKLAATVEGWFTR